MTQKTGVAPLGTPCAAVLVLISSLRPPQQIYKEREMIEGAIKKQAPLLKNFNEFEYGFKIRDKENPKNWRAPLSRA